MGFILAAFACWSASAHEIRPALLQIVEVENNMYHVTMKIPARGNMVLAVTPIFPEGFEAVTPAIPRMTPVAYIEHTTMKSTRGENLYGKKIMIDGLNTLQIDVLVKVDFLDGTTLSSLVQSKDPIFQVPERGSKAQVAGSYFVMGVEHILGGIDHLLFVLALLLIVNNYWKLLKTITAFTVAHSITLALASLGLVNVPSAPTEAIIALSIVFLCVEILKNRSGQKSITERHPWIVALLFGLFHGLGFAGALSEVGLPQHEIPLALLMFNVGVEAGQVMFVAAIVLLKLVINRVRVPWPSWSWKMMPYAIGSVAAFWTIQRVFSFLW